MGSEARTRLGLWGLLFAALLTFNQVFATGDYPGPAILGILLSTGLVMGMRRLGAGSTLTLIVSAAGLLWYLSLVFEAEHTFWTLPTSGSLSHLRLAIERAMEHSRVDYAPVPLRPGYALQIVGGLWVAATIGELATFRWRQPLLATLVPLTLFGVALVVGTGTGSVFYVAFFLAMLLTYLGLESAHRVRSWGRWVSAWSHHKETEPASLMGSLGRRIGGGAIVLALVAPLFLPALGDGLLAWRTGIGTGAGDGSSSGSARLNPWVQINSTAVEQSTAELFEVKTPFAAYWRVASLEEFDGLGWNEASEATETAVGGDVDPIITFASPGVLADRTVTQEVKITGLRGNGLPSAVTPTGVVRLGAEGDEATAGISYDIDSASIKVRDGLEEGDTFQISSTIADPGFGEMSAARPVDPSLVPEIFLQIPEGTITPGIRRLIGRWTADAETPFQELVAVQSNLRGFIYDVTPDLPQTGNVLEAFLLRSRQGFCQQFATAFAVIARELGYPARVSVGFLPGERDTTEDLYTVRGTDAHAWPEVFFEGYGWIAFEPTPRSEAPPVEYTTNPQQPTTGGIVGTGDSADLARRNGQGQAGPAFGEAGGLLRGGGLDDVGPSQSRTGRDVVVDTRWKETFGLIVTVLGIAILLFLLSVPALKEMRTRRRYARAEGNDDVAEAAFVHFQREAGELAEPRRPSESALVYARRLAKSGRVTEKQAVRLAAIYESAAYGPRDISSEQASEARRLAGRLRSQLWAKSPWPSRAARLFSPRGLTS